MTDERTQRREDYHRANGDTITDDGFWVGPSKRWDGRTRQWIEGLYAAGPLTEWADGQTGKTADEALGKARKAQARRAAQRQEDQVIERDFLSAARAVAGYARPQQPATGVPASLTVGQRVWLWAHGKARIGIVGSVSKTGARARMIYATPSGTHHVSTYSRTDLTEVTA